MNKSILISTLNEDTCPQLLGHSINLWEEFYRNLFRDRIEAIIGKKFQLFYFIILCVVLVKVNYDVHLNEQFPKMNMDRLLNKPYVNGVVLTGQNQFQNTASLFIRDYVNSGGLDLSKEVL